MGEAEGGVSEPGHQGESVRTVWWRQRCPGPVRRRGRGRGRGPAAQPADRSGLLTLPGAAGQSRADLTPTQQPDARDPR